MSDSHFVRWLDKEKHIIIKEFTSEPPRKIIRNIFVIIFGAFVYSIADSFFLIPMNIISGGVTSLALIFNAIPFFSNLSVQFYVLIITWLFFIIGLFMIGLKYSLKQLIFSIFYPIFDFFFAWIIKICVVDGVEILNLSQLTIDLTLSNGVVIEASSSGMLVLSYIVAIILGGSIMGIGIGLTFVGGGSSGGTDVINILVNRYTGIRVATSSFVCDMLIILGGFFINGYNFLATLCGIITAFLCSYMLDKTYMGMNKFYLAQIISSKWSEINGFINNDLGRGTTLLEGKGGYTKNNQMIIEACFDKQDYALIKESIYQIDPNAFVMVYKAKEILGYGFSRENPKVDENEVSVSKDDTKKLLDKATRKKKRTFYYDEK